MPHTIRSNTAPLILFRKEDLVTLLVGESESSYIVDGRHLAKASAFFAAALKKEWIEGKERTIKLPEEDPKTFVHYLNFLFTGSLYYGFKYIVEPADAEDMNKTYTRLCHLYLVGERLLDNEIRNRIVDELTRLVEVPSINGIGYVPSSASAAILYGGTTEGAPVRRLLTDFAVMHGNELWFQETGYDPVWVLDVARGLLKSASKRKEKSIVSGNY